MVPPVLLMMRRYATSNFMLFERVSSVELKQRIPETDG